VGVGLIPTATATAVPVTPKTGALALVLPAPTGPRAIGELQLHLVDASRNDPWVPTKKRELMASVWYPAAGGGPRVPYVSAKLAPVLAADWLPLIGLEGPELDNAHTWTHARATAPAYGQFPGGRIATATMPFLQFGHENHSHRKEPSFADYQWAIPQLAAEYDVPDEVVTAGIGTVTPSRSIAAQRAYLLAYFDQFLKGRPQALLRQESPR
jgi:hypothetical protein